MSDGLKRKSIFGGRDSAVTVIFSFVGILTLLPGLVATTRVCGFAPSEADSGSVDEETVEVCLKESTFCYSLWKFENATGEPIFLKQGCWEASPKAACENDACIASSIRPDQSLFCCCAPDNCNWNVSYVPSDDEEEFGPFSERMGLDHIESHFERQTLLSGPIVAVILTLFFIFCVGLVGVCFVWRRRVAQLTSGGAKAAAIRMDPEVGEKLMEPSTKFNWEVTLPLSLGDEIAQGKFARVYNGRSGGENVALKVFELTNRDYFENEKYIYHCLGKLSHENILKYRGWQEFAVSSDANLILILDKISPGNLRDFLSAEDISLDMPQTLKILKGLASGLSFLHGENSDNVVIAHRDLTSKNILIDKNLVPYIADYGLSLRIKGSRYYFCGQERHAEFCSLSDAGTLRYMAPELLEGAVNLKDLENSLKQADIYALALLIWEIANRSPVALESWHELPYTTELGKDITVERLTSHVVTRRQRPQFIKWCDIPAARLIRDTLNESWDPEPDARLTALCVVERLADLSVTLQQQNNKNKPTTKCTTPLEFPAEAEPEPDESAWKDRNICIERNMLEENSDKSTQYLLTTSEKHRVNFYNGGGHSSSVGTVESLATTNTELSNGSSLPPPPPPVPIQYLQNIRR